MPLITGEIYGRLTVISETISVYYGKQRMRRWTCKCSCGQERIVHQAALTTGHTKSCGCLNKEITSAIKTVHGASLKTSKLRRTFLTWVGMRRRCSDAKHGPYRYYGGRGITVCDRWLNSFENFLADMGERPNGMTIERKNNNLGYFKDNCRWAIHLDQCNNRRRNLRFNHLGRTMTVSQWSRELGVSDKLIYGRLEDGWSFSDAVTIPVRTCRLLKMQVPPME